MDLVSERQRMATDDLAMMLDISRACTVTILTDHSKLEKTALFEVCSLDKIDRVVIDQAPSAAFAAAAREAKAQIIVAEA